MYKPKKSRQFKSKQRYMKTMSEKIVNSINIFTWSGTEILNKMLFYIYYIIL